MTLYQYWSLLTTRPPGWAGIQGTWEAVVTAAHAAHPDLFASAWTYLRDIP